MKDLPYRSNMIRLGLSARAATVLVAQMDLAEYVPKDINDVREFAKKNVTMKWRGCGKKTSSEIAAWAASEQPGEAEAQPAACETCRFWHYGENDKEGCVPLGQCRRHSPQWMLGSSKALLLAGCCVPGEESEEQADYGSATDAVWPVTRNWDWCGEHQPDARASVS